MEEAEWLVEVMKSTGKPAAITMCIGPQGDLRNVSPGECAVRLVRAGIEYVAFRCIACMRSEGKRNTVLEEVPYPAKTLLNCFVVHGVLCRRMLTKSLLRLCHSTIIINTRAPDAQTDNNNGHPSVSRDYGHTLCARS